MGTCYCSRIGAIRSKMEAEERPSAVMERNGAKGRAAGAAGRVPGASDRAPGHDASGRTGRLTRRSLAVRAGRRQAWASIRCRLARNNEDVLDTLYGLGGDGPARMLTNSAGFDTEEVRSGKGGRGRTAPDAGNDAVGSGTWHAEELSADEVCAPVGQVPRLVGAFQPLSSSLLPGASTHRRLLEGARDDGSAQPVTIGAAAYSSLTFLTLNCMPNSGSG
ncbi:uncharacterized protein SCHCODRAFT_02240940 [Schizophyllum commune H4-8]|uniref:uncharacterized protein n=1 Tax=Schizophyllum commune (strain H4-8 / FGSC 9210) TaxID=578458 RepID=UPI00215E6BE8|nr:uncharacterized protein SCHCODRAFT_02240940 [Schizophyllum commune H4-8]KAI5895840.1 hypothetical protein SCHCODRAFT_02240940 [Schizophyllum commune H4-8]